MSDASILPTCQSVEKQDVKETPSSETTSTPMPNNTSSTDAKEDNVNVKSLLLNLMYTLLFYGIMASVYIGLQALGVVSPKLLGTFLDGWADSFPFWKNETFSKVCTLYSGCIGIVLIRTVTTVTGKHPFYRLKLRLECPKEGLPSPNNASSTDLREDDVQYSSANLLLGIFYITLFFGFTCLTVLYVQAIGFDHLFVMVCIFYSATVGIFAIITATVTDHHPLFFLKLLVRRHKVGSQALEGEKA